MSDKTNYSEPITDAMADCVLPHDIMLSILTRLPVKSLIRFRSVCRPWCELIATRKFMKMHHDQFSNDPKNQALIMFSLPERSCEPTISLLSTESDWRKPTNLGYSCPGIFRPGELLGCCNGLFCGAFAPFNLGFVLWNPASRLSKFVRFSDQDVEVRNKVLSLGFGYDAEEADFKVVRIICPKGLGRGVGGVDVYSANSDSWKTIQLDFEFSILHNKNDAIVNGIPYWIAKVDGNQVLVWFDVRKLVFKILPLLSTLEAQRELLFVDWKGSLAALVCAKSYDRESVESIDVWVFDDGEFIWRKNLSFVPTGIELLRLWQCSRNGAILGKTMADKLFVFYPERGLVEEIDGSDHFGHYAIYQYTESMAYVEGMERLLMKMEDWEVEDGHMAGQIAKIKPFLSSLLWDWHRQNLRLGDQVWGFNQT